MKWTRHQLFTGVLLLAILLNVPPARLLTLPVRPAWVDPQGPITPALVQHHAEAMESKEPGEREVTAQFDRIPVSVVTTTPVFDDSVDPRLFLPRPIRSEVLNPAAFQLASSWGNDEELPVQAVFDDSVDPRVFLPALPRKAARKSIAFRLDGSWRNDEWLAAPRV